jgi:hypothetical protein
MLLSEIESRLVMGSHLAIIENFCWYCPFGSLKLRVSTTPKAECLAVKSSKKKEVNVRAQLIFLF